METVVYYVTMGTCLLGCTARLLLAGYYRGLYRALRAMKSSRNRTVTDLKRQFITRYQAMLGVPNVDYFVGRFLAERRLLGIRLSIWNSIHIQLIGFCLLFGATASFFFVLQDREIGTILSALFQGILTSSLLLFVDGVCMIPAKVEGLRESFCDYLENYFKVRLEHEYEIWGKNDEDRKISKAAMEAQLMVADEREYHRKKRREAKACRREEAFAKRQAKKEAKFAAKQEKEADRLRRQEKRRMEKKIAVQTRLEKGGRAERYPAEERQEAKNLTKNNLRRETELLKQEVKERRRRESEAAAARETESEEQRQVEELLREFLTNC